MRQSLLESGFWYGNALRCLGLPYGAVPAAVKMVQWLEVFHGLGTTCLERYRREPMVFDPGAARVLAEDKTSLAVEGGGQSSLLLGPGLLDIVTVKAQREGHAVARATGLSHLAFLGALAERAAARGLAAVVTFQAEAGSGEAEDLATLYSAGRGIVALPLPGAPAPLWAELAAAPTLHGLIFAEALPLGEALAENALVPAADDQPGCSLLCLDPAALDLESFAATLRRAARDDGAKLLEPAEVAQLKRQAVERGLEVDDRAWQRLARFALTAVVPSSEESRAQAGADG
jgi:hypothetical protein